MVINICKSVNIGTQCLSNKFTGTLGTFVSYRDKKKKKSKFHVYSYHLVLFIYFLSKSNGILTKMTKTITPGIIEEQKIYTRITKGLSRYL